MVFSDYRSYQKKPFESDSERLAFLFKMYEKMTKKQNRE
jgi:hypothetical protein